MAIPSGRILRWWSGLAAVPAAAAASDALTEFLANAKLLGGHSPSDLQHQALVPTLLVAVVSILAVALFALCMNPEPAETSQRSTTAEKLVMTGALLVATFAVAVMMEGYETRFGGTAPFDPHSVLISHAPAVLICYAVITALVRNLVCACLHVAIAAGRLATQRILQLLRIDRRSPRARFANSFSFDPALTQENSPVVPRAHGLRAPPLRQPLALQT
ncbi:MAG: hypothetical protein ACXWNK_14620 [Vulcanimicrobiaceae bacterium]